MRTLLALLPALSLLGFLACGAGSGTSAADHGGASAGGAGAISGQSNQAGGGTANAGGSALAGSAGDNAGSLAGGGSGNALGGASSAGSSSGGAANAGAANAGASAGGNANAGAPNGGASGGPASGCGAIGGGALSGLPTQAQVLQLLRLSNDYFVAKWPDPSINIDKAHASNIWTRAVYYEGLMALYGVETDATRKASYYDYAVKWGSSASHPWQLVGGVTTRSADNQCSGQTYLDLYQIDAQAVRVHDIKADIDAMVSSTGNGDWTWVDAIQMSMPVFAKLGVAFASTGYFDKMHALYVNAKTTQGFYNPTDHLWWRDKTFEPPFTTPNSKQCYWSRGNGWVFAALTRVLGIVPSNAPNRAEYVADFSAMAAALQKAQRSDGFWNVSLADPNDHGGPESTGTALFMYGMAWGVRTGLLDAASYGPTIAKAWCALTSAVHSNGALGYAQGSGSKPADSQPVTFDSVPDYPDFPLGCLLLGGSEVWRLATP
jgi:unsaturated rhamnogalacturonyl hydrolase